METLEYVIGYKASRFMICKTFLEHLLLQAFVLMQVHILLSPIKHNLGDDYNSATIMSAAS